MSSGKTIKVMVVEDEPVLLNYIIGKIESVNSVFKVIASAYNGKDALSKIHQLKPDILITDIKMPVMDGIELIRNIKPVYPAMQIAILSGHGEFQYAQQAIKLGVNDFLLKPLNYESLIETLDKMKDTIYSQYDSIEREILFSGLHGQSSTNELPYSFNNSVFLLCFISIGHLCNHVTSIRGSQFYKQLWEQVRWEEALADILKDLRGWWIVDEKISNEKFLVLTTNMPKQDILKAIIALQNHIISSISPYPVNFCVGFEPVEYKDIWLTAQKLRDILEKKLVMGRSQLFTTVEEDYTLISPLNPGSMNKISSLLESHNLELLHQAIYGLFDSWEKSGFPQRIIEKALLQIFKIFQDMNPFITDKQISDMELQLFEIISVCTDFKSIYNGIWDIMCHFLPQNPMGKETAAKIANDIEEYLIKNYMTDISLEELASRFGFSSAYMTKIFKKYKSDTPLKYIINLRIDDAKNLIITHPDLDMKVISEMVGYEDQHYFSKVFKSIVGKTPTEFRNDCQ